MADKELHKKLDGVEQHLDNLEQKPKKDAWNKLSTHIAVLIPAAIALAGHFISQGISRAQIASEERQAAQSRLIAEANTRIGQAELLNTFMQSLTSENVNERKIAINAILIALQDQGPTIVNGVAKFDDNQEVQMSAEASLNSRLRQLIEDLFVIESITR